VRAWPRSAEELRGQSHAMPCHADSLLGGKDDGLMDACIACIEHPAYRHGIP
jgi:hypothetical protein